MIFLLSIFLWCMQLIIISIRPLVFSIKLAKTLIGTHLAFKICRNGKDKFSKQFQFSIVLEPNSNTFKFTKDERIFVVGCSVILKYCTVFACLINEFSIILQNDSLFF